MRHNRRQYRMVLAGMLSVAIAFGAVIALGFWLGPLYPATPDWIIGTMLAIILVGIAASVMRLFGYPLWPARKRETGTAMRPDPDTEPTGYEISFHDFRRLVSHPSSQPVIAPLLREWYRYEISGQGPDTVVRSEEGHVVGLRALHNRIQIDPPKQHTIYNRAMDLWR